MTRDVVTTLKTALVSEELSPVFLVELGFDAGALNLWNGMGSLSYVAPALVINGTFATDTDWTKGTGWTIASSVASCDGTQVGDTDLEPTVDLAVVAGETYRVGFTLSNRSAGTVKAVIGGAESAAQNADAAYSFDLVATTTGSLDIRGDSTFVGDIDDVTVKQVLSNEGTTYLGAGHLMSISDAEETSTVVARGLTIMLSGIPSATLSLALSEPFQQRVCTVRIGLKDSLSTTILFSGEIDQMNLEEGGQTSIVTIKVESDLSMLDREVLRFYTDSSQKSRFPTDDFFSYVTNLGVEHQWGGGN